MARGMNKVMLIGRVGEEPKVTALQNGTVANFSFATSDSYIDAQGNKQEKTEWHRLTAWGKTAEIVQKYIHKGDCLYVEGKIQYREYEKNGEKRYATDIVIHELNMLSERKENAGNGNAYQNAPRNNAPVQNNVYNRAQAKPQQAYNTPMQNAQPQPQPILFHRLSHSHRFRMSIMRNYLSNRRLRKRKGFRFKNRKPF